MASGERTAKPHEPRPDGPLAAHSLTPRGSADPLWRPFQARGLCSGKREQRRPRAGGEGCAAPCYARFKLDDELSATPAGSFVFIPRGVAHCFQNVGEEPGRMLVTFTPAGMEGFFERLSELTAFDLDTFRRAAAEHGMEVVGPPLAQSDPL